MRDPRRIAAAAVLLILAAIVITSSVAARNIAPADYLDMEQVADPQLSPDGTQVIYTRRWVNTMSDDWASSLWIVNADGSRHRFLTDGSDARWAPDGTRIAYLDEGDNESTQIFVRWMDGEGATSQVTHLVEEPANILWSPNGRNIAFTALVPAKDSWKVDLPDEPEGAEWTKPPRLVEHMHYRQDRRGFLENGFNHLFVVPADGGTPRALTEGSWNVGARTSGIVDDVTLSWTPDGREIVFDGLRADDADTRYRESHVYAVNLASRAIRQITHRKGPWTTPVVSPNGKLVAFVGYDWTAQTYKADELYVIGIDGTNARRISGDFDRDPTSLHWAADGRGVYFNADDRGSRNVYYASVQGSVRPVTTGVQMLSLTSIGPNGVAVGVRTTPQRPADTVAFKLNRNATVKQLTDLHSDILADVTLGAVEELWYTSKDGTRVQGWLVQPPDFNPQQKYPLILHIHGGPHSMYGVGFNFSFQDFAAKGNLVLYTNPRGSTGYGTAFGNAIHDAYPSVDYEDLMAGVDAVEARGYVDPTRLYVTGVSGGGVLSSWIIGHNNRFAAAAVRAPVINWISFAGNTDITAWGYARFEKPFWENPQKWLEHSPLMYVKNVRTPTLLMTGELDLRTPIGQAEEYYQALKTLGVPTAMLRFHEEYHGTGSKPANFIRTQQYIASWFDKYPGPASVTTRR